MKIKDSLSIFHLLTIINGSTTTIPNNARADEQCHARNGGREGEAVRWTMHAWGSLRSFWPCVLFLFCSSCLGLLSVLFLSVFLFVFLPCLYAVVWQLTTPFHTMHLSSAPPQPQTKKSKSQLHKQWYHGRTFSIAQAWGIQASSSEKAPAKNAGVKGRSQHIFPNSESQYCHYLIVEVDSS